MPTFRYTAKALDGSVVKKTAEAADEIKLNEILRADGLFLITCHAQKEKKRRTKVKAMELSDFCRQLGTMLASGISLLRAVEIIGDRDIKPKLKVVYLNLVDSLRQGVSLSEAMKAEGETFPSLLIHMFEAGEASGTMEQTAMKMSAHYEKEHRLKMKLRNAAAYPIILLFVTVIVMVAIFTFVLPNFFEMYEGATLPAITRFVMGVSKVITGHWLFIVVAVVGAVFLWKALIALPKVRYTIDKKKLRLPLIGKLLRTIYTARFSRTLSSLYSSGLTMIEALNVSRETVGNAYISTQFDSVLTQIKEGIPLSTAMATVDGFDIKLASTVMIGEETGRLDDMLESVADAFDYEADMATQKLTTILEPLLIIIMAVIVGTVMISVLLPIYDMYNSINA